MPPWVMHIWQCSMLSLLLKLLYYFSRLTFHVSVYVLIRAVNRCSEHRQWLWIIYGDDSPFGHLRMTAGVWSSAGQEGALGGTLGRRRRQILPVGVEYNVYPGSSSLLGYIGCGNLPPQSLAGQSIRCQSQPSSQPVNEWPIKRVLCTQKIICRNEQMSKFMLANCTGCLRKS